MEVLSFAIRLFFYLFIAVPLCTVAHELGHAAGILLLTRQSVIFQFGIHGRMREIRLGRLTLRLQPDLSALLFCRYYLHDWQALTRTQAMIIIAGGPLVTLLLAMVSGVLWAFGPGGDPWSGLTLINLISLTNTAIPHFYPAWQGAQAGLPNDALALVRLVKARHG